MKKKNPPVILSQAALIFTEYQDGKKCVVRIQTMGSGDAHTLATNYRKIIEHYEQRKRKGAK